MHARRWVWLLAAALLAPTAASTWYAYGSYEPDTTLDVAGLMRSATPGLATNLVYFNAYASSGPRTEGQNGELINPNVGVLRTNVDPIVDAYFEAVLGVWADCNGDGYVGMLETAVREYDARLLLDDSICPRVTGPRTSWTPGAHNYNGWVTELIPIGNRETTIGDDARVYKDDAAMVWAEPTKPDDASAPPGVQCEGRTRGSTRTTGGILHWFDCQGNNGYVARFNEIDGTLGLGLGFGDHPPSSSSPLNVETFGDDESEHSAATLQDCSEPPILATDSSPPGDDLDNFVILRPVPDDPVHGDVEDWTVPGTLNETVETFGFLPDDNTGDGARSTSNCDYQDDAGQDFYRFLESNTDVPPHQGKDAAWSNFAFQTGSRGTLPATFYPSGGSGVTQGGGRGGVSTDLGIELLGANCGPSSCVQSGWNGAFLGLWVSPTVRVRADLLSDPEHPTVDAKIAPAPHYTFYAYTGAATSDRGLRAPGGSGVYGSAQCGDNDSGTHNGWNCDAAAWYRRSDGSYSPNPGGVGVMARVGAAYNHRDVDCFDGRLGDTGVGASAAFYGDAPCERPGVG